MTCLQAKSMLSAYLDGVVAGKRMPALHEHLQRCHRCNHEYQALRCTQSMLAKIGHARAPEDLSLRVRLAISREAARAPYFASFATRVENALRGFMVPATA